jgi:hypothetical protein
VINITEEEVIIKRGMAEEVEETIEGEIEVDTTRAMEEEVIIKDQGQEISHFKPTNLMMKTK